VEVSGQTFAEEADGQRATAALEECYAAAVAVGGVEAVPGAAEAMARLGEAGIRVCLAAGFAPAPRDAVIDKLGGRPLIALALSPADAGRGRPWPDIPLTALLRLGGGAVSELAVVGDTPSDIESGRRAGAGLVAGGLTGRASRGELAEAKAAGILDSGAGPPAALGVSAWPRRRALGRWPSRHERSATCTGEPSRLTWTDPPGASAVAVALGTSTCTVTSPDSRTWIRVTDPRKVRLVTMPLPPAMAAIRRFSGRTSTSTAPGGTSAQPLWTSVTVPSPVAWPPLVSSPGMRFIVPTNSATNAVAGRV